MGWDPQVRAGFETQAQEEFIRFNIAGGTPVISSTKARTGTYSLRLSSTAQAAFTWSAASSRAQVGAAMNHGGVSGSSGSAILFDLRDETDNTIARVSWRGSDNNLILQVGGVEQDSESATLSGFAGEDTWHEIGIQANIVNDAGGFVSFWVNGAKRLSYSGAITTDGAASLRLGGSTGSTVWSSLYVDDLMLDTSTTAETDAAPPNIQLPFVPVTGAGSSSQWTAVGAATNWEAVDDPTGPDHDTTYVETDTNNHRDLYTFGGYTAPEGYTIEAVIPVFVARKTASSSAMQIEAVVFDGTNTGVSAAIDLPSTYGYLWHRFAEKPAGGGAWGTSIGATAAIGMDAVVP